MAVIQKELKLVGSKGGRELVGLFDSGATYSCIDWGLAEELGMLIPLRDPLLLKTAEAGRTVEVRERVVLDFYLDGYLLGRVHGHPRPFGTAHHRGLHDAEVALQARF